MLNKYIGNIIKDSYFRLKLFNTAISISFIGALVPVILEYTNTKIEFTFIIISILTITGSWITKLL